MEAAGCGVVGAHRRHRRVPARRGAVGTANSIQIHALGVDTRHVCCGVSVSPCARIVCRWEDGGCMCAYAYVRACAGARVRVARGCGVACSRPSRPHPTTTTTHRLAHHPLPPQCPFPRWRPVAMVLPRPQPLLPQQPAAPLRPQSRHDVNARRHPAATTSRRRHSSSLSHSRTHAPPLPTRRCRVALPCHGRHRRHRRHHRPLRP